LGLLGGAIIGSQYSYDGDDYAYGAGYSVVPQDGGDNSVSYCQSTYKSYNPATGMYLGYDGLHHPCP
jgi:hypothetical protein